ncbi:ABC transporter permease [uncultured Nocardioides sp.]|uniref:Dipeptide transport system permease protein DppB n=1 Tax=uncultured Nocardioides sp. TaxID=198441 RepID=A0A6J4PQR8_9ACTN|nr:ABC transporter permease [uncultured Nocardioides sp.]CAA9419351.1 MAG: Dipeptide transport system permease protein DppB [uncultured Nocardioides sp.]
MFAYIIKRLLTGVVVVVLVSMAVFALLWYGPESPARPICVQETSNRCTDERLANFEESMGYNNPIYVEYGKYAKGIFVGREMALGGNTIQCDAPCFGFSFRSRALVWDELIERLPATISLAIGGATLYLLLGIPIGIAAARRRGTLGDKLLVSSFLVISSIPYYLFALVAWLYCTLVWDLPVLGDSGYTPLLDNPAKWFAGLLLPWLCLGIFNCTAYTRYTRGAMVESLSEDYIRTAKAKGLPARTVVYKHGLRSALVPVVTIFGIDLGILLAGTIFTERIFEIQGIGLWGLRAVGSFDLPVISATAMFGAIVIIVSNIIVDVVYGVLDPRVRVS